MRRILILFHPGALYFQSPTQLAPVTDNVGPTCIWYEATCRVIPYDNIININNNIIINIIIIINIWRIPASVHIHR